MALSGFSVSRLRRAPSSRVPKNGGSIDSSNNASVETKRGLIPPLRLRHVDIKRATRARKIISILTSFLSLVATIFSILVIIGNTHIKPVLRSTYFMKLDMSNVIPESVPNAVLINSIAQSLGLHDFYQVGLWNFCEGYNDQGLTDCSKPRSSYWFNPVEIIVNELLAGATIALPGTITNALNIAKTASHAMFALFIAGVVFSFISIFVAPSSVYTRRITVPVTILVFLAALSTTVASVVATVMFTIFRNTFTQTDVVDIGASFGIQMFVFMWLASACTLIAFLLQLGSCCCCASRRDVRTGRKRGSKKAYLNGQSWEGEKTRDT